MRADVVKAMWSGNVRQEIGYRTTSEYGHHDLYDPNWSEAEIDKLCAETLPGLVRTKLIRWIIDTPGT